MYKYCGMYPCPLLLLWFLRGPVRLNSATLISCHNHGKRHSSFKISGSGDVFSVCWAIKCVLVLWQSQPGCCLRPYEAEMPFACWESCTWSHGRVWGAAIGENWSGLRSVSLGGNVVTYL